MENKIFKKFRILEQKVSNFDSLSEQNHRSKINISSTSPNRRSLDLNYLLHIFPLPACDKLGLPQITVRYKYFHLNRSRHDASHS